MKRLLFYIHYSYISGIIRFRNFLSTGILHFYLLYIQYFLLCSGFYHPPISIWFHMSRTGRNWGQHEMLTKIMIDFSVSSPSLHLVGVELGSEQHMLHVSEYAHQFSSAGWFTVVLLPHDVFQLTGHMIPAVFNKCNCYCCIGWLE